VRFPWSCASSRPLFSAHFHKNNLCFEKKGGHVMSNNDVPIWEKYTLTIEEASKYFRIGENKLRRLAEENPTAGWVILNGNRIQIKRKQFEKIIDSLDTI
jgi:excisionase family DNA binding protein